jgi:hypothetical protein
MSEYDFSEDEEEMARPRVSKETHLMIKEFSAQAGKGVTESYDDIIQAVLDNENVLTYLLEEVCDEPNEITGMYVERLEGLAFLIEDLDRFPTMYEINRADETLGYPTYLNIFGSLQKIVDTLEEHYPEAYDALEP